MSFVQSDSMLINDIVEIIDHGRRNLHMQMNSGTVLIFCQISRRIRNEELDAGRAAYGMEIVSLLATQLSWSANLMLKIL